MTWSAEASKEGSSRQTDHIILAYYPPLMIDLDSDRPGISIEIIREAAKRLNRKLTYEFLPFKRALKTLRKRNDAIQPALFRNPTREPDYNWVWKTHSVQNTFLTLGKAIKSMKEARALNVIGVETAATMDVYLSKAGFTNLERVDRPDVNVNKLRTGRIDAWALTQSLAEWTWKRAGETQNLNVGFPVQKADVYVTTGKKFPAELSEKYRTALQSMKDDGTLDRILLRYR